MEVFATTLKYGSQFTESAFWQWARQLFYSYQTILHCWAVSWHTRIWRLTGHFRMASLKFSRVFSLAATVQLRILESPLFIRAWVHFCLRFHLYLAFGRIGENP